MKDKAIPEHIQPLLDLFNQGHTYPEIGAKVGKSKNTILKLLKPYSAYRKNRRLWADKEDRKLAILWETGIPTHQELVKIFNRDLSAIYSRARKLKLGLRCPPGCESIYNATKRVGFGDYRTLLKILENANVKPYFSPLSKGKSKFYKIEEITEAVKAWMECEPADRIATRNGIAPSTLLIWLQEAGEIEAINSAPIYRVNTETAETIIKERKSKSSMSVPHKLWTTQEINKLDELLKKRVSFATMAKELNRPIKSVYAAVKRFKRVRRCRWQAKYINKVRLRKKFADFWLELGLEIVRNNQ